MDSSKSDLKVICLESQAFYALIDEVVSRIRKDDGVEQDKWVDDEEAMKILKISSKTTLKRYRDQGNVRYAQIGRKVILYDRDSILNFM